MTGNDQQKTGSFLIGRIDVETSTQVFCYLAAHGEAKTHSWLERVYLIEALKNLFVVLFSNTRPRICHGKL